MTSVVQRSNPELLDDLRDEVERQPRRRLHVHPESVLWILIGVQHAGLSPHVQVVGDPACREAGKGWIETLTVEQWRGMRALVGSRVTVTTRLGTMTGVLKALNQHEAQLDPGDGAVRYLSWISVEPTE